MQKKIAHFEILEELGRGGMGVVYKALDTRLQRYVAIKVLPPHMVADEKNLRRFLQEAQAASALNHPHICTVYDIGEVDGRSFIVMEFIDGEHLRQILDRRGSLPEQEVIEIGLQICDALQATHEKGIIHRDIKPENIMISRDGYVKVMDFGLAKLKLGEMEPRDTRELTADFYTNAVLAQSSMSSLVGTVSYMSPEQIEKRPVDERTDIFSLGIVLYELIAGQSPFRGSDNITVLESILNDTPQPLSAFGKTRAKEWDKIILKALAKEPDSRYTTIAKFYSRLKQLQTAQAKRRERINRITLLLIFFVLILSGLLSIFVFPKNKAVPLPPSPKFYPIGRTFEEERYPSFSPNGNTIAYISFNTKYEDLCFKDLRNGKMKILPKLGYYYVDWSPDGTKIACYQSNPTRIIIADTSGANEITISNFGFKPKWSPNGRFIAFSYCDATVFPGSKNAIYVYDRYNRSIRQISPDSDLKFADPEWSPDGRWVVCVAGEGSLYELRLIELATGKAFPLTDYKTWITNPVWCPNGKFIYFISNRNGPAMIWRVSVDIRKGKLDGEPLQVPVGINILNFDISPDGDKLVFVRSEEKEKLWQIPFAKAQSNSLSEAKLIMSNLAGIEDIEVSPDGTSLVLDVLVSGIREIMVRSLIDSIESVLYREQPAFAPCWSADGRWIAFDAGGGNNADIWRIPASGGQAEKIIENPGADWMPTYSPDGKYLCFLSNRTGQFDLWVKNLTTGEISQITNTPAFESRGFWSHDSKKLAYIQEPKSIWIYDFSLQKAEQIFYSSHWLSGYGIANKIAWKDDDSALYYFDYRTMQETSGKAILELFLEDKQQRMILRPQAEMQIYQGTFEIFKNVIYFITKESNMDIWLAEGLR